MTSRITTLFRFVLMAILVAPCLSVAQQAQEHEIKAAFLYKFAAFVEWPPMERPEAPFVIAVYGADDVAAELRRLVQSAGLRGRAVQVRTPKENESPASAQLLFVGRDSPRLPALARSLAGMPVLIVSEAPGALEQGSMINFLLRDGRVRFEVAPEPAERSRLRISSRLLAAAQSVRSPKL
jgi:hypothetical protein